MLATPSQFFGLHMWLNTSPCGPFRSSAKRSFVRQHKEWPLPHLEQVLRRLLFVFGLSPSQLLGLLCFWRVFNCPPTPGPLSEIWSLVWAQVLGYGKSQGVLLRACVWGLNCREFLGSQGTVRLKRILLYYAHLVSDLSRGAETILYHEPAKETKRKCIMSFLWNRTF